MNTPDPPDELTCTSCGTDLHGQRWNFTCCQPCEDWIRDQLNTIEHLWQELPTHLEPRRAPAGTRVSGSPQAGRLPASENVLNLIGPGGVPDRLERHDAVIRIARHMTGTPRQGTADTRLAHTIRSLRRHLPWAAEHVDIYDLAAELRALAGELAAATRQEPPERTTRTLMRTCPRITEAGTECGGTLRYDRTTHLVHCDTCGRELEHTQWAALAAHAA